MRSTVILLLVMVVWNCYGLNMITAVVLLGLKYICTCLSVYLSFTYRHLSIVIYLSTLLLPFLCAEVCLWYHRMYAC